jgi:NAD(P)-dependent dehydrogenase (short-subunit alcohol dehydrogenase family)
MSTVLITGANRGIGLALTEVFRAHGHTVIAAARNLDTAEALRATGAECVTLDVSDAASVNALATDLKNRPIDFFINNAGIGDRAAIGQLDFDAFERVLKVNTIAPIRLIEAFTAHVAASDHKTIASISSLMGSIDDVGSGGGLAYRTSKAALNMALRTAAFTLAPKGITLLTLHPGWVQTDMGGPSAPVTREDSAKGLYKVITTAGPSETLRFQDFEGKTLAW